ncbi:hypothetical protein IWZ01DRAFT_98952 [Phyllosticta capitalensis]
MGKMTTPNASETWMLLVSVSLSVCRNFTSKPRRGVTDGEKCWYYTYANAIPELCMSVFGSQLHPALWELVSLWRQYRGESGSTARLIKTLMTFSAERALQSIWGNGEQAARRHDVQRSAGRPVCFVWGRQGVRAPGMTKWNDGHGILALWQQESHHRRRTDRVRPF